MVFTLFPNAKRQFKVEVKLDFLKKETVVDSILACYQGKWKEEEVEEEDVGPSHYKHPS